MRFAKTFLISALAAPIAGLPVDHHGHRQSTGHGALTAASGSIVHRKPTLPKRELSTTEKAARLHEYGEIHKGLNPHHNAGQQADDKHHFKYRFQRLEEEGDLVYYEYEAKRGPHVTFIEPDRYTACSTHVDKSGNATVTLTMSQDKWKEANLKPGSMIVSKEGLSCTLPNGKHVRAMDHIVSPPKMLKTSGPAVTASFHVRSAQVHHAFKEMTVEYYRGKPENLEYHRGKHAASSKKMAVHNKHNHKFATSERVVADARAKKTPALPAPKAHHEKKVTNDKGAVFSPTMVHMPGGHKHKKSERITRKDGQITGQSSCWTTPWMNLYHMDSNACAQSYEPSELTDNNGFNCAIHYSSEFVMVPGGTYKMDWDPSSYPDDDVMLKLYEYDSVSDDYCLDLPWKDNGQPTLRSMKFGQGSVYFVMPTMEGLEGNSCMDDGWSYPEFTIRLEETDGCYYASTADLIGEFRLLQDDDLVLDKDATFTASYSDSYTTEDGSATASYEVSCTGCGVQLDGDAHVIIRTSNYMPFEEVWTYGDVGLKATLDFKAVITASASKSIDFTPVDKACIAPICYGTTLCGMGVDIGLRFGLGVEVSLSFDATLTLEFKRVVEQKVEFGGHAIDRGILSYDFDATYNFMDPEDESADESDTDRTALTIEVNAEAKLIAMPVIDLGLWAEAGDTAAHAAITLDVNLTGAVNAKAKFGYGDASDFSISAITQSDGCQAMDLDDTDKDNWGATCCGTSGLPYCYQADVCTKAHNVQIDVHFEVEAHASLELHAQTTWGGWTDLQTFTFTRYLTKDFGLSSDDQLFFHMYCHLATFCWSPVSA